jgi:hypothetical protein
MSVPDRTPKGGVVLDRVITRPCMHNGRTFYAVQNVRFQRLSFIVRARFRYFEFDFVLVRLLCLSLLVTWSE